MVKAAINIGYVKGKLGCMRYLLVVSASPAVKGEAKQRTAVDGVSSNTKFNRSKCSFYKNIVTLLYCCALRLRNFTSIQTNTLKKKT